MMNKVTIITPLYNCAKFINLTVASVLNQNYPFIEYIVIDDCSTDNPVIKYKSNQMRVIRNPQNLGEQATVNLGLSLVKTDYFMIVNADDPLLPGAVKRLVDEMNKHPDVLCAYPDWKSINEDGSLRLQVKSRDYDFSYMVRHHTCLPSVGSMFRSSVIEKIGYRDTSYRWLGDFDYWLRVGLAGKMLHVPATLATWRNRNGQASKDKSDKRAKEHIRIGHILALRLERTYKKEIIKQAVAWSYLVAASVTDSKIQTLRYCLKAVTTYPRLLISLEFWDALIQRAKYILKR